MDERTFETLELQELIELAARHVQTAPGKLRMLSLRPSASRFEVQRELEITGECVTYLNTRGRFGLSGIEDLEPVLGQLHIEGTSLEPKQILAIERLLFIGKEVKELIKSAESGGAGPHLARIAFGIPDLKPLLAAVHGKILPNGEVDDNASPELKAVRKDLTERRNRIHRTLESIFRGQEHAVREEFITFRNGRFVIPVRTDSRNQVPGVVHGLSSSGQTTFVEPMTVINQNNDLVRLREQEGIEVSRILLSITESFRANLEPIKTILGIVTQLDVAQAKAIFAAEYSCVPPRITEDKTYLLRDARHILLEHSLRASGEKPVPISLELDRNDQVLVISGPNAGGKTVVLKTAGLLSLMAQMGFHVPARDAVLPIFDQIFADIGDHQSIAANLSTFTAHMCRIAETAQRVHPPALVLLDEVGTGTDPDEGSALAIAIVEFFRRVGATTIASTHYPGLKMWASQTAGVRNASVEFDERTLRPTYRLVLGIAGASSGLEIARRMQVTEEIIEKARALLEPSHAQAREYLRQLKETLGEQESLRASLEEERAAVAEKYSKLETEFARKEESRKKEFDAALERAIGEFKEESDRAVRRIKDQAEASRLKKQAAKQAMELHRKSVKMRTDADASSVAQGSADPQQAAPPSPSEEIAEGDRVRIQSLGREGIVEYIHDASCVVMVGPLRYHAEPEDLIKIGGRDKPTPVSPAHSLVSAGEDEIISELKVIGLTADEALDRVDKFLDQAYMAGVENVRIIHGHGKGILRKAIGKFLAEHPQVERFSLAPLDQGGGGATIVELRK
ncbi:MAG TPA: endonuclease MutS2 [Acidobacteriota bacterium]|nr:endonuclease MutS2 [Acidobacteriota bacterium]